MINWKSWIFKTINVSEIYLQLWVHFKIVTDVIVSYMLINMGLEV